LNFASVSGLVERRHLDRRNRHVACRDHDRVVGADDRTRAGHLEQVRDEAHRHHVAAGGTLGHRLLAVLDAAALEVAGLAACDGGHELAERAEPSVGVVVGVRPASHQHGRRLTGGDTLAAALTRGELGPLRLDGLRLGDLGIDAGELGAELFVAGDLLGVAAAVLGLGGVEDAGHLDLDLRATLHQLLQCAHWFDPLLGSRGTPEKPLVRRLCSGTCRGWGLAAGAAQLEAESFDLDGARRLVSRSVLGAGARPLRCFLDLVDED
jgi:hypothetical protein